MAGGSLADLNYWRYPTARYRCSDKLSSWQRATELRSQKAGHRASIRDWTVFDPWIDPDLLSRQGHKHTPITKPLQIESHFRRVLNRLTGSLSRLHGHFREWDRFLSSGALAGPDPDLVF